MQVAAKGLHVELSPSYVERFEQGIQTMLEKYFGRADKADVVLSKRQGDFVSEVHIHIGKELQFKASGLARNAYQSLDMAMKALAKQLRRNKRRLREDHSMKPEMEAGPDSILVNRDQVAEASDGGIDAPLVIAEKATKLPQLTVSQASMILERSGDPWMIWYFSVAVGPNVTRIKLSIAWK